MKRHRGRRVCVSWALAIPISSILARELRQLRYRIGVVPAGTVRIEV